MLRFVCAHETRRMRRCSSAIDCQMTLWPWAMCLWEPRYRHDDGKVLGDGQARLVNTSFVRDSRSARIRRLITYSSMRFDCMMSTSSRDAFPDAVCYAGSPIAVNLHRGFGLLNSTIQSWTHRRPSHARCHSDSAYLTRGLRYQFERTGNFNGRGPDVPVGVATAGFGRDSLPAPPGALWTCKHFRDRDGQKGGRKSWFPSSSMSASSVGTRSSSLRAGYRL